MLVEGRRALCGASRPGSLHQGERVSIQHEREEDRVRRVDRAGRVGKFVGATLDR